jgi:predicted HTH transcriptional regulator
MPSPLEIFEHPADHWDLLTAPTDDEFEQQHFDRKEAARDAGGNAISTAQVDRLRDVITETVSAFANANREGGLLVIGISKKGVVLGVGHLTETQRNSITNINNLLSNQSARSTFEDCTDQSGAANRICLIYVPYTEGSICQTNGNSPKAWMRQGSQNLLLNEQQKEQLKRDKRILDFEKQYCCLFDQAELDSGVMGEFRRFALANSESKLTDPELLYQVGALLKDGKDYAFTKAGFLFFASNPQRMLNWASVRILRYEGMMQQEAQPGLVSFERTFTGPISQQIRQIRSYIQSSGLFKTYQIRKAAGGFREESELPLIAVDEAIVNAVAHRDYAVQLPIECRKFSDAFSVTNPGRILQRDQDVPKEFSLDYVSLDHIPRNPVLLQWLKELRDERSNAFVRALSEGTKKMKSEMEQLGLPAPVYRVTPAQTKVILYNNSAEREALIRSSSAPRTTEFTNLFPLGFSSETEAIDLVSMRSRRTELLNILAQSLQSHDWFIDRISHSRIIAHKRGIELPIPREVARYVRFYPSYSFQIRQYWDQYYLSVDYELSVKNVRTVVELLREFSEEEMVGLSADANWRKWLRGQMTAVGPEWTTVFLYEFESQEQIPSNKVIPSLPVKMIQASIARSGTSFDLHKAIRQASISMEPAAARVRASRSEAIAADIAQNIFPLQMNGISVRLQPTPASVVRDPRVLGALYAESLSEPTVEFNHGNESPDIRDGITKFGSYDHSAKTIELVPLCKAELRNSMASLIERLKVGKYKYRGAERTFSTRLTYSSIVTADKSSQLVDEARRLLSEHPGWVGEQGLSRLFLVHTPESEYALDDESSPYYVMKRLLLEAGVPCQMVDTPTLINPDYKDLNLALNVIAKCGVTPWVLPDAVPDADFFVGLSYTQHRSRARERLMGYANVFNRYGRWMFYSGNSETFPYEEKTSRFESLVEETLRMLELSDTPSVYFHYSAKFSKEDVRAILAAARRVKKNGTYSFVWINTHHQVRFYDRRIEGDGSMRRGTYVATSPNQMYLSTTGDNPYRRALGTPQVLEVNIRSERGGRPLSSSPDLKALAVQILSLTKLNWASTDSLCGEPITTKYAGDIAYLTAAFLRQGQKFRLHPVLEKTPWFL